MSAFEYTLASDLHMDTGHTSQLSKMQWSKSVILAGDLGNGLGNFKFVEKLKRRGCDVFAVDGNHEHYANARSGRSILETETRFYEMLGSIYSQPGGRQAQAVMIRDDLFLIGCNGWYTVSDPRHWKNYMNDHYAGCASEVNDAAKRQANWLGEQLVSLPHDAKAIVVTHTAPTEASLDPRYAGSDGNEYYWSPHLEHVMTTCADSIAVWHHGHTHAAVNLLRRSGRPAIVTNPRGYPRENPEWSPLLCRQA